MDIQQLSVKISAQSSDFDEDELIPIFHRWIREKRLGDDQLLIDVADYRHVVNGPGVMIIGNEAHYGLDHGGGQLGMLYGRKRDPIGDPTARLREGFGKVLQACDALAQEPTAAGKISFNPGQVEVRIMSRLVAPNTADAYQGFQPVLQRFLSELYGTDEITCEHLADARSPFGIKVAIAGNYTAGALSARLSA